MTKSGTLVIETAALRATAAELGADPSWIELFTERVAERSRPPRLNPSTVLIYVGGGLCLVAMTVFLGMSATVGAGGVLATLLAYAGFFVALAEVSRWRNHPLAAGVLAAVAVGLTPAIVMAFQASAGLWDDTTYLEYQDFYSYISSVWVAMEVTTIIVAALAVWRYRSALALAPALLAGYFLAMDGAALVSSGDTASPVVAGSVLAFGVLVLSAGWMLDAARQISYAFWAHVFGIHGVVVGIIWVSFGLEWSSSMLEALLLGFAATLFAYGAVVVRRISLYAGAVITLGVLCSLSMRVGAGLLLPAVVAAVGVAVIAFGVAVSRYGDDWARRGRAHLPAAVLRVIPTPIRD